MLLLTEGLEPKSHQGAIQQLSLHFVKPGRLLPEDSHLFSRMMKYQEEADYEPAYVFTQEDVRRMREEVDALSGKILGLIREAGFKT